ncbi:MAG: glycosyltransferase [Cyanobacteria bacterium P01_G01_bin.67]
MQDLGIVAIGRNEGDRLRQCLHSVVNLVNDIVYVDSGSTDGSIFMAKSLGVKVLQLDLSRPFTAARARNEGFTYLISNNPQLRFVQFVDGDCEIAEGWLQSAYDLISNKPELAVICGRRRERFPTQSIYNLLCDIEWNTPVGETDACGGDSIMRISAFRQVKGFNSTLIAGEEPELCLRLRHQGWKILRHDAEMTLHDAQITRFKQWWQRSLRAGHAYAEVFNLHAGNKENYWAKENKSILLWGLILPLLILGLFWFTNGWILWLLLGYIVITYKTYTYMLTTGLGKRESLIYAISCILAKFPQVQGQTQFYFGKLLGKQNDLIEYKRGVTKKKAS